MAYRLAWVLAPHTSPVKKTEMKLAKLRFCGRHVTSGRLSDLRNERAVSGGFANLDGIEAGFQNDSWAASAAGLALQVRVAFVRPCRLQSVAGKLRINVAGMAV